MCQVNDYHSFTHTFIGSVEGKTHFNPNQGEPEVDPLFPLFHTFIDYIRLMRQDCYDYDLVNAEDLESVMPMAYKDSGNMSLDYAMLQQRCCWTLSTNQYQNLKLLKIIVWNC